MTTACPRAPSDEKNRGKTEENKLILAAESNETTYEYKYNMCIFPQSPEKMCLLENQNPSKTSEKMGYFDRVTVSLHIL